MTKKRTTSKVLSVRTLTDSTAVIRFERHGLEFEPGQYIRVGVEGDPEIRDYSVYSGAQADYLEVLVRRVEDGLRGAVVLLQRDDLGLVLHPAQLQGSLEPLAGIR